MTKVFIAHGPKSREDTLELKEFLRGLGLHPVLLEDCPDNGLTIIEKFEQFATPCIAAITLLTPDDNLNDSLAARQNVILELGWFMRHVGRGSVLILHKQGTVIPSNIHGVLYLPFKSSVLETTEGIRGRLRSAGLIP